MRALLAILLAGAIVTLSACAHRDLVAPCEFSGGFNLGPALARDCGEARPINQNRVP